MPLSVVARAVRAEARLRHEDAERELLLVRGALPADLACRRDKNSIPPVADPQDHLAPKPPSRPSLLSEQGLVGGRDALELHPGRHRLEALQLAKQGEAGARRQAVTLLTYGQV